MAHNVIINLRRACTTLPGTSDVEPEATAVYVQTECTGRSTKGWGARVTLAAKGGKYPLERAWLDTYDEDVTQSSGNGTKRYRLTEPGWYEFDSQWRSMATHRTLVHVTRGDDGALEASCYETSVALRRMREERDEADARAAQGPTREDVPADVVVL